MKQELRDFAETRIQLFTREVKEKLGRLKVAAPLAAVAIILLGTAYLLITSAVVALIAIAFGGAAYRWVFAFGIVAIVWAALGAIALYIAKSELELKRLLPQKTIQVLKEDKTWMQREVRNQI
jgi:uncharacterized membrane protein YqjE